MLTADINDFDTAPNQFNRILSIEMFEHMKNYEKLLARISTWLKPNGIQELRVADHVLQLHATRGHEDLILSSNRHSNLTVFCEYFYDGHGKFFSIKTIQYFFKANEW